MIDLLLRAKHWQLFIILIVIPITLQFNYLNLYSIFPYVMVVVNFLVFAWIWSIAIGLQENLPDHISMKTKKFKTFFFISLIYFTAVVFAIGGFGELNLNQYLNENSTAMVILIPVHLFSAFCAFYCLYFTAKTIKTIEKRNKVSFGDFTVEFFLIWFYIVGIWIIQPKVNKLYKRRNTTANNV